MAFKADAAKIKRWREERQWSQEHLAELSGLGLRTVQRIENGEGASRDSLMALASAFNVEVMALAIDVEAEAEALVQKRMVKIRSRLRLSFFIHLVVFVLGMFVFLAIDMGLGGELGVMPWPMLWWSVAVAVHGATLAIIEVYARMGGDR